MVYTHILRFTELFFHFRQHVVEKYMFPYASMSLVDGKRFVVYNKARNITKGAFYNERRMEFGSHL